MHTPKHARTRLAPIAAATALALGVASCDAPTTPEDLTGIYVLARAGDQTVPTAWRQALFGDVELRILAETIYLRPGRVGEEVRVYSYLINGTTDTVTERQSDSFEYTLDHGFRLRFMSPHDPTSPFSGQSYRTDLFDGKSIISGDYLYTYRGRVPPS